MTKKTYPIPSDWLESDQQYLESQIWDVKRYVDSHRSIGVRNKLRYWIEWGERRIDELKTKELLGITDENSN